MDDDSVLGAHWDAAYDHGDATRSWYQTEPDTSLRMLDGCGIGPTHSVVDVGGGASPLVGALLRRGHRDLTVVDVSANGLAIARQRLDADGSLVHWQVADVLTWRPPRTFSVWHDRAVFHFLVTDEQRRQYLRTLTAATGPGAVAVFGTFAADGPEFCSGLPVARYEPGQLARVLGDAWHPTAADREEHATPSGAIQPFTWVALQRG